MMSNNKPLISVITVSYNAVSTIEKTILSIINQTYLYIDYVIIDGGSADGTVDIIKKYHDKIAYWVSEPDNGIYDAMNKGVEIISGEWLIFMNSGDCFYNDNVLHDIASHLTGQRDIVYGDTYVKYGFIESIVKAKEWSHVKYEMPFSHQSVFVRVHLLKDSHFDVRFKIAGDYNFFYTCFMSNIGAHYVDLVVSMYDHVSGVSSTNHILRAKEHLSVQRHRNSLLWQINFWISIYKAILMDGLAKYFPFVINKIRLAWFLLKSGKSNGRSNRDSFVSI